MTKFPCMRPRFPILGNLVKSHFSPTDHRKGRTSDQGQSDRDTQAIALAHKGHQQVNGTLRRMRASMWFRMMWSEVQAYVGSCKFQTAIPWNPTPPLKLKPLPKIPWWTTYVNYKGPIGPGKWYVHTQMDGYTHYPEVHITQLETLKEWRNQSVPMGDRTRSGATAAHHTTPINGPSGSRTAKSKQRRP